MRYLDLTLPLPLENLACDEALLDSCEDEGREEILRVWEAREPFVVVGYANRVAVEVDLAACAARGLPVYRRCSGGGTVVQGPGCLSYALVLRIDPAGPLRSIVAANRFIMERNRAALETAWTATREARETPEARAGFSVQGHTDLAIGGLKFSGNAQRRKKRFLLFHGTFLLQFDLPLIQAVLKTPSRQPTYRRNRDHRDFLTNLAVPAEAVKRALQQAWHAFDPAGDPPKETLALLLRHNYATS